MQDAPLEAHCALVTLPLGVLRKGSVKFSPALPAFKRDAIDSLEMGTENRVAMLFPHVRLSLTFYRPTHPLVGLNELESKMLEHMNRLMVGVQ
jgi:hypothetical protein